MKKVLVFLSLITCTINAQTNLKFDKKYVQCEDKWIAKQMNNDSTYVFGFIYIDEQAGLTVNYEGKFKIINNVFVRQKEDTLSFKVRLEPNNVTAIAEIPEERVKELGIEKYPEWLKYYKENENSIERLYRWGFLYNSWNECEKALVYLEKAQKIDPHFKGLEFELAYAYNATEQYYKAISILQEAIKMAPKECYLYKELSYSEVQSGNLDNAVEAYKAAIKVCTEKDIKAEMAINIAQEYYFIKDTSNFEIWRKKTLKWATRGDKFWTQIEKLEHELRD